MADKSKRPLKLGRTDLSDLSQMQIDPARQEALAKLAERDPEAARAALKRLEEGFNN